MFFFFEAVNVGTAYMDKQRSYLVCIKYKWHKVQKTSEVKSGNLTSLYRSQFPYHFKEKSE